jgi:hypothetical protein
VINVNEVLEGLLAPISALAANTPQAERDFTSWMGSAGVFASGSGLLELKAGLAIESKDPARSQAAVGKLGAVLAQAGDSVEHTSLPGTDAAIGVKVNGLPVVLYIANGRDAAGHTKLVVGLGEESINAALRPTSTLANAASTANAATALGEGIRPSIIVDVRTLVSLLEALGLTEEGALRQAVPLLRQVTTVAGGGHSLGGGVERFKLLLELR